MIKPSHTEARLIADCGGLIEEMAITVPLALFSAEHAAKIAVLGRLVEALPAGITLFLMTDDPAAPAFSAWCRGLAIRCDIQLVACGGPLEAADIWTQDPWMLATREGALVAQHLPHTERPGRQALWLAAHRQIACEQMPVHLAGGNTLTGPDFRLLGTQSVELTRSLGPGPIAYAEALARHAELDPRPIHLFGFALPARAGHPVDLRQQPHHLDLVTSLTGKTTSDGKPIILLADPHKTADPDGPRMEGWAEQLDGTAERLAVDGFHVIRNKVPYLAARTYTAGPTLRPYNNVFLENAVRPGQTRPMIWLPQFADLEPDLDRYDSVNRQAWAELGFIAVPVPGCSALVRSGGAIRCLSKVLKRKMAQPAEPAEPKIRKQGTLETIS